VVFLDYSHSQHESSTLTQEAGNPTNQRSVFKSFIHCIYKYGLGFVSFCPTHTVKCSNECNTNSLLGNYLMSFMKHNYVQLHKHTSFLNWDNTVLVHALILSKNVSQTELTWNTAVKLTPVLTTHPINSFITNTSIKIILKC